MTIAELAQLIKDTMEEMEYQMNHGQKEKYLDRYLQIWQLMDEIETIVNEVNEDLNEENFHL